jgi:hypothetical protein
MIEFVFPELEKKIGEAKKGIKLEPIHIDDFLKALKGFKVDTIEVWIEGIVKSEGILQLVVSAEGKSGIKIVLKPEMG